MKKLGLLFIIAALLFSFNACGKVKEKEEASNPDVKQDISNKEAESDKNEKVPDVTVPKEEKPKEEKKEESKKPSKEENDGAIEVPSADSFFSSLPTELIYENKGEKTLIKMNGDGTFTGNCTKDGEKTAFKGKFSQAFPLDNYTYVSVLENYTVTDKGNGSLKNAMDGMKEVVFYMPGAPVKTISDEFLRQLPDYENFGEALPNNLYGMFDMTNRTGFYGTK